MRYKRNILPAAVAVATCALPATAAAEETKCTGAMGPVTVDNLLVPSESMCTLDGTQVKGTVKVERAATLDAKAIRVVGNVQADGATRVKLDASELGGSLQVKQGGGADVSNTRLIGDIQLDANTGAQRVVSNDVNGSVQVVANNGGVEISLNLIDGNLQCKENNPPPTGGGNVVQGNAEDQCAGLANGSPANAGPGSGQPTTAPAVGAGRASLAATRLRASRGGRVVSVPVRCARGGATCVGAVRVTGRHAGARAARAGVTRFRLAAGERRSVRVRLARRDRAALRRAGRLGVRVVVSTAGATVRRAALVRS